MKAKQILLAAFLAVTLIACAAPQRQQQSAATGAAIGAGAGAIIGHQFGRGGRDAGALLGAAIGGTTGLIYGQNEQARQNQQSYPAPAQSQGYYHQNQEPRNDDFRNPYQTPAAQYCRGRWQWDATSSYWLCQP